MRDFYLVLQVDPRATTEEIRSAYRRRALEVHPDQSGAGSEAFIELQKAYSVLSDPTQRAAYDRQAETIPIRRAARCGSIRCSRAEPLRDIERFRQFEFEELFEQLWSDWNLLFRIKG